jgi:beta-1,4-N-acetylglucosaminyltransferase
VFEHVTTFPIRELEKSSTLTSICFTAFSLTSPSTPSFVTTLQLNNVTVIDSDFTQLELITMLIPIILATVLTLLIALAIASTSRLLSILPPNRPKPIKRRRVRSFSVSGVPSKYNASSRSQTPPYNHILIVLGSGGHTAEMLLMTQNIGLEKWRRRTWIVSSGDAFSARKAAELEEEMFWNIGGGERRVGQWEVVEVPRARKIHQGLLTTPFSALRCLWACWGVLGRWDAPDLLLTNGPGTGVITILASLILRFFDFSGSGAGKTRVVYVESLARVKKLSLSGRILVRVADRFLVQWEELEAMGEYVGAVTLDAVKKAELVDGKAEDMIEESTKTKKNRIRFEM